ncbi:MAG: hypothetical protein Q9M25_06945 [Mariprofundaceae bacterium]|nr:hypothetical protein [Mariprofundaceae bacterium]
MFSAQLFWPELRLKRAAIFAAFVIAGVFSLPPALAAGQTEKVAGNALSQVAKLIFRNECAARTACLTSWNRGEAFASLGIGHFIWYPADVTERDKRFKESFPALLRFMQAKGVRFPGWLADARGCPWLDKNSFEKAQNSQKMIVFREFLIKTMPLQAAFMQQRLADALPLMLTSLETDQRTHVRQQFERVAAAPMGAYVLTDYVNFKGEGIRVSERYRGRGWGLMQVLEAMQGENSGLAAIEEFSRAAVMVLQRRVANAPTQRHEARWLPGWQKRIVSYMREARKLLRRDATNHSL